MRTLIIGHSFVRRYRKYLRQLAPEDFDIPNIGITADFGNHFGLAARRTVNVQGRSGLALNSYGIFYIKDRIARCQPELLVLEIGTNDISHGARPQEVVHKLDSLFEELVNYSSVKFIVVNQLVQRRKNRHCSNEVFERQRLAYNALLQNLAKNHPEHVFVFRHDRSILVNLQPDRITTDEIHITSPEGLQLYHLSMRRAITKAQTILEFGYSK